MDPRGRIGIHIGIGISMIPIHTSPCQYFKITENVPISIHRILIGSLGSNQVALIITKVHMEPMLRSSQNLLCVL